MRRAAQPQPETKKSQLSQPIRTAQLPKQPVFQPIIAQRLQALRTAAEAKRRADAQQQIQAIASINPDVIAAQMPCDPNSQTPQIRHISPNEVRPGYNVLIQGCGFQTKDDQSTVIISAPSYPYGMFWDYYKKSPKSYPLDIDSWTPTTIEARIPALEGFSDTIPARLEVRKGAVYASHAIQLRPEMEIQIAGDFSNLINVDHSSSDCLAMKDYEQWTVGGYVHRIPKIIHFSTKSTQSSYCQGQDKINLQNLKLPNGYTFYDYQLITTCLSYDASGVGSWHWEGCTKSNAKLDQNLGSIKGKTSLPDVTVSWYCEAYGSGTAYTLTINVEGPKGVVWP